MPFGLVVNFKYIFSISDSFQVKINLNLVIIIFISFFIILLLCLYNRLKKKILNKKLLDQKHEIGKQNRSLEKANFELKEYAEELKQQKEEIIAQAESLENALKNLRELNEFKEGLIAMIVHDLKNPLNIILNNSNDKFVLQPAGQMLNMVNNILDVQKYETVKMPVFPARLDLNSAIENSILKVNHLIIQKAIQIGNFIPEKLFAFADLELLDRIMVNLLTNAIKYTPMNGKISINTELSEYGKLKISISDNGPGIPDALRDRVFDKFTQIIAKKSGFTRSTGLGLTFCKLAVEAQGGNIGVDSIVGQGTTFWFTLPSQEKELFKNEALIIKEENFSLKTDDFKFFIPFFEKLRNCKVYEISKIQSIVSEMKKLEIQEAETFIQAIENAAYTVNQQEFEKLINLIK
ncbi:MAG: HAMP domain-containing sensor histidine kinase [Bacteroidales bacterium]